MSSPHKLTNFFHIMIPLKHAQESHISKMTFMSSKTPLRFLLEKQTTLILSNSCQSLLCMDVSEIEILDVAQLPAVLCGMTWGSLDFLVAHIYWACTLIILLLMCC